MLPPQPQPPTSASAPDDSSRDADGSSGDKDTKPTKTTARATEHVETAQSNQTSQREITGSSVLEGKQGPKPGQPKLGAKEEVAVTASDTYNKKPKVVQPVEKEEEGVSFVLRQAKQVARDQVDDSVRYDQGSLRKTDLGDETTDNSRSGEKPKAVGSSRLVNELGENLGKKFPALSGMLHAARLVSDASW